ncbi:phage minor capsid protein [Bacillus sp. JJ1533]|uniref:phage minor capsid protein n=1 Tax=Bacillus sp. JJ1533 TaxID=3122959 RepID=UPI002FFFEEBD
MSLNVPVPEYDYKVNKLVNAYKKGIQSLILEMSRYDVSDLSRANTIAMLAYLSEVLSEIDEESVKWVEEVIPVIVRDGTIRTLINLNVVDTIEEAQQIIKFNRLNKELIKVAIADTQSDLLAVTDKIETNVRLAVRKAFGESMRENMAAGINGYKTIKRDTIQALEKLLKDALEGSIIYADGRRVKPSDYVDMLVRTKMMDIYNEAHTNEAISRGAFYAVISSHGAKDACRFHEGRIIKLTSEAPGDYPTYDELKASGQIFHHRCKHTYSVIRTIDSLPSSVLDKANKQSEIGSKALSTGKRNPVLED